MAPQEGRRRRRSARMVMRIPLFINTADNAGGTDWEPVETVMVSKHGGMVRARQNFKIGDMLDIRVRDKDRSAQARVVWRSSELTPQGIELGFEILNQDGFWDVKFPPDRWSEKTRPQSGKK